MSICRVAALPDLEGKKIKLNVLIDRWGMPYDTPPLILTRTVQSTVLNDLTRTYQAV
ncbi:hypothetical protein WP5S18E01_11670 [Enterobacter cloacae]|jgi:hypothetical protein|nr:hypothetical protein WP5S18E01_11670 [Enterobacter cloacae]